MTALTRWFIKSALVYLAAALLLVLLLALQPALWTWLPAHIKFLPMGWIVQLTLGVVFFALHSWKRVVPREGA